MRLTTYHHQLHQRRGAGMGKSYLQAPGAIHYEPLQAQPNWMARPTQGLGGDQRWGYPSGHPAVLSRWAGTYQGWGSKRGDETMRSSKMAAESIGWLMSLVCGWTGRGLDLVPHRCGASILRQPTRWDYLALTLTIPLRSWPSSRNRSASCSRSALSVPVQKHIRDVTGLITGLCCPCT